MRSETEFLVHSCLAAVVVVDMAIVVDMVTADMGDMAASLYSEEDMAVAVVARVQGFVVFVKNGKAGQKVKVKVKKVGNRYATATTAI